MSFPYPCDMALLPWEEAAVRAYANDVICLTIFEYSYLVYKREIQNLLRLQSLFGNKETKITQTKTT